MEGNPVSNKSIGELVDSLITTNLRCWFAQEFIMDESLTAEQRLAAAVRAQKMNSKRTNLMMAIDAYFGEESVSLAAKTYHTYLEKK